MLDQLVIVRFKLGIHIHVYAFVDDHIAAILDFVTFGLVVVLWDMVNSHFGPFALSQLAPFHWSTLSNPNQLDLRYLHYSEKHLLEASPVKTVYAGPSDHR